ncbi:hypothetical protein SUGI_0118470 [Cryptomeria japonica]|nr:hypothetical protein SUGI_0118470 [Cryptomeria japonica]
MRVSNIFQFEERDFLTRVKIILGEEYLNATFKYRSNIDVASMFTMWCFELELKEIVRWVVENCIREEWRGDFDNLMEMA